MELGPIRVAVPTAAFRDEHVETLLRGKTSRHRTSLHRGRKAANCGAYVNRDMVSAISSLSPVTTTAGIVGQLPVMQLGFVSAILSGENSNERAKKETKDEK